MSHTNIVRLIEELNPNDQFGSPFSAFVMWYVPDTLLDLARGEIESEGALTDEAIWSMFKDMTSVLDYISYYGICHGDIKPANILVDNSHSHLATRRRRKLVFKLAHWGHASSQSDRVLNVGTRSFAAPETRPQGTGVETASDIWSLMLTCMYRLNGATFAAMADRTIDHGTRTGHQRLRDRYRLIALHDMRFFRFIDCLYEDPSRRPTASQLKDRQSEYVCFRERTLDRLRTDKVKILSVVIGQVSYEALRAPLTFATYIDITHATRYCPSQACRFRPCHHHEDEATRVGTRIFAAPETREGGSGAFTASDIWSLMVTTLWCLESEVRHALQNGSINASTAGGHHTLRNFYRRITARNFELRPFRACLEELPGHRPSAGQLRSLQAEFICFGVPGLDRMRKDNIKRARELRNG